MCLIALALSAWSRLHRGQELAWKSPPKPVFFSDLHSIRSSLFIDFFFFYYYQNFLSAQYNRLSEIKCNSFLLTKTTWLKYMFTWLSQTIVYTLPKQYNNLCEYARECWALAIPRKFNSLYFIPLCSLFFFVFVVVYHFHRIEFHGE